VSSSRFTVEVPLRIVIWAETKTEALRLARRTRPLGNLPRGRVVEEVSSAKHACTYCGKRNINLIASFDAANQKHWFHRQCFRKFRRG